MANPNPKTEHLKEWQFKKGQIANPEGRKGSKKSLKERAKEKLAHMTDEEAEEYLDGLSKLDIWKMAEGNPSNETEIKGDLTISQVLDELDGQKTSGQNVEDEQPLPNTKQRRTIDKVPAEQNTDGLQ